MEHTKIAKNSPIVFLFVSDTIAQIMEENAIGATCLSKDHQQLFKSNDYVFQQREHTSHQHVSNKKH
jgi:hypothetical protein